MMLESFKHEEYCFVTLTYSNEFYPPDGSLRPKDAQLWLKRLRKAVHPVSFRFFLVGEYGDETGRAHYHAILFGLGESAASIVQQTWGKGNTLTGSFTHDSAQYVAGYTIKKMTGKDDERLDGRHPEFARMSLRPGIGAKAMEDVARSLTSQHGVKALIENQDVPTTLRHGSKLMPLGRYLTRRLRNESGLSFEGANPLGLEKRRSELQDMFKNTFGLRALKQEAWDFAYGQEIRNQESRFRIHQSNKVKI
jgi:hypothetical protein